MRDAMATFQLSEIPDPRFAGFRLLVADPKQAIWGGFEHVLRYTCGLPSGTITFSLRLVYDPTRGAVHPQKRLAVNLVVRAADNATLESAVFLLTNGPLAKFVRWRQENATDIPWDKMTAATYLRRRETLVGPLVAREQNAYVPAKYYTCDPIAPNPTNDFLTLDRVLDGIAERVVIAITVAPADISRERGQHALYLSQIEKVNRPWSVRQDPIVDAGDFDTAGTGLARTVTLSPLHRPDPAAEHVVRGQQEMQRTLQMPHLAFSIVTVAETETVANIVGATLGDSAFREGNYASVTTSDGETVGKIKEALRRIETLPGRLGTAEVAELGDYQAFARLSGVASTDELVGAFRPPIAVAGNPLCIRKNTAPPDLDGPDVIVLGQDSIAADTFKANRGIRSRDLTRHMLIGGAPGSGKTTCDLSVQIDSAKMGIPTITIECAKTEERALKKLKDHPVTHIRELAERLEIYTPGKRTRSPLRFNPLQVFPGSSLEEHSDTLLRVFEAAMPQGGPMQSVLAHSIDRVYETIGRSRTPELEDLTAAALHVIRGKAYSSDTRADLMGAVETRCGILTRGLIGSVFRTAECIPSVEHLLTAHTIIELDSLPPYPSALLILSLLNAIRAALRRAPRTDRLPRLLILITEAHRLLRHGGAAAPSQDFPDPRAYVVELVCEMLAELRALGVGVVISDQQPSKLAPEIVSLTGTKVAFRLVDRADREVMAASMLFDLREYDDIARLSPGEAYLYTGGFHEPRKIRTTNLHDQMDLTPPTDAELMEIICGEVV